VQLGLATWGGRQMIYKKMNLVPVDPQPTWVAADGQWDWPLPSRARFPGCQTSVRTDRREWWEYAPSEAKPHPMAEAVMLRDGNWYWAVPCGEGEIERPKAGGHCDQE
jgi:hypothetical protein